jgi:drug/metabolite transporter (DMT)-like permease
MNEAIGYAMAAMVCYGVGDFIYKRAAGVGIRADHFLLAQSWFFCPLIIVYALVTSTLVLVPAALWGALAGAAAFVGLYYFIRSLAAGSVSINAAIFRLNFIVTAVLAIVVFGEPLTRGKIGGLALALIATWLLLGSDRAGSGPQDHAWRRSLIEVLVAAVAFGAANFFHTVGLRLGALPETLAAAQAILFTPLATAVVYLVDRKLPPPAITFRYGSAAAVVLIGATVGLLHGVARGEASVLVPIAQMGFIVTALLAAVLLRESLSVRRVVGLAAALGALAVLAAG